MAMNTREMSERARSLIDGGREAPWLEFKCNYDVAEDIGEYISALANSAALWGKTNAYLVWGVEDVSHDVIGTSFSPGRSKKGNEELENWLLRLLNPKIHFCFVEFNVDGKQVSMLEIPRAAHQPVQFQGIEYIRVGSYRQKLKDYPEKERELWRIFDVTPFEHVTAGIGPIKQAEQIEQRRFAGTGRPHHRHILARRNT
jgi:predicted HTH transcriptional regulator